MIGITKNVKLDVVQSDIITDPWNNERAAFTITGKIKRSDWDLSWNQALEAGGVLVSDEVSIHCEVQLIKEKEIELRKELEPAPQKITTF
jgi:polyisoprenoid-binding protein YceI